MATANALLHISFGERNGLLRFTGLGRDEQPQRASMRNVSRATVIGLAAGVVCFLILVPFLAVFFLIVSAIRHTHPNMIWIIKIALPVAALTAVLGFILTLIRAALNIDKEKGKLL